MSFDFLFETSNQIPETRNKKLETRNKKPETLNLKLETSTPLPYKPITP
jgi:hypothetical protein